MTKRTLGKFLALLSIISGVVSFLGLLFVLIPCFGDCSNSRDVIDIIIHRIGIGGFLTAVAISICVFLIGKFLSQQIMEQGASSPTTQHKKTSFKLELSFLIGFLALLGFLAMQAVTHGFSIVNSVLLFGLVFLIPFAILYGIAKFIQIMLD